MRTSSGGPKAERRTYGQNQEDPGSDKPLRVHGDTGPSGGLQKNPDPRPSGASIEHVKVLKGSVSSDRTALTS